MRGSAPRRAAARRARVDAATRRAASWLVLGALLAAVALGPACARRPAAVPAGPDKFPEFAYPLVPEDLQKAAAASLGPHDRAWRLLQAGDPREAERGFAAVLQRRADFFPAETGLGYVDLARGNADRAVQRFDRVVARAPTYLPALLGRAQSLLRAERPDEALVAFEAVLAVDPSLADVRRRVDALRFRGVDAALADARKAEQAGDWERARAAYEAAAAASPDSAFLYRDLARAERRLGRGDEALGHLRRAVELDPADASAYQLLSELQEARGDWDAAIVALERARDLDGSPELEAALSSLRDRAALARLPAEYRAIAQSDRLTRGELAALIGVGLDSVLGEAKRSPAVLVTDVRAHWARPWILSVARAGVMEAFENHTFQPRGAVRRGDLAQAVSRVLALLSQRAPALGAKWRSVRPSFSDIGPSNLYFTAASLAVAAGILDPGAGGTFQAGRVVSGQEGVDAVNRLAALARTTGGQP